MRVIDTAIHRPGEAASALPVGSHWWPQRLARGETAREPGRQPRKVGTRTGGAGGAPAWAGPGGGAKEDIEGVVEIEGFSNANSASWTLIPGEARTRMPDSRLTPLVARPRQIVVGNDGPGARFMTGGSDQDTWPSLARLSSKSFDNVSRGDPPVANSARRTTDDKKVCRGIATRCLRERAPCPGHFNGARAPHKRRSRSNQPRVGVITPGTASFI